MGTIRTHTFFSLPALMFILMKNSFAMETYPCIHVINNEISRPRTSSSDSIMDNPTACNTDGDFVNIEKDHSMDVSEQMEKQAYAKSVSIKSNGLSDGKSNPLFPDNNTNLLYTARPLTDSTTEEYMNAGPSRAVADYKYSEGSLISYSDNRKPYDIADPNLDVKPNDNVTMEFKGDQGTQPENDWLASVPNDRIQYVRKDSLISREQWLGALNGILKLKEIRNVEKEYKPTPECENIIKSTEHFFRNLASIIQAPRGLNGNLINDNEFRWWLIQKIFTALKCGLMSSFCETSKCVKFLSQHKAEFSEKQLTLLFPTKTVKNFYNFSSIGINAITSTCLLSSDMFGDRCSQTGLTNNFLLTLLTLLKETAIKRFRYIAYLKKRVPQNAHHFYAAYMEGDHDKGAVLLIAEQQKNNYLPNVSEFKDMLMVSFANILNIKKYILAFKWLEIERLKLLKQWLQSGDSGIPELPGNSTFALRIKIGIREKDYSNGKYSDFSKLLKKVLRTNAIFLEFPLKYKNFPRKRRNLNKAIELYRGIMTEHIEGSKPVGFFEEITIADFSNKNQNFIHKGIRKDILTKLNADSQPVKLTFILPFNRLLYDKIKEGLGIEESPTDIERNKILSEYAEELEKKTEKNRGLYDSNNKRTKKVRKVKRAKGEEESEESEENEEYEMKERGFVPYAAQIQKWVSEEKSLREFLDFFRDLKLRLSSIKLNIWIDLEENIFYPKGKIVIRMNNKEAYLSRNKLEENYKAKILNFFTDQLDYLETERPGR